MSDYRFGDETPPAQRSDRVYLDRAAGGWFFSTREGAAVGPHDTEQQARDALRDFIEFIQLADLETLNAFTRTLVPDDQAPPADAPDVPDGTGISPLR